MSGLGPREPGPGGGGRGETPRFRLLLLCTGNSCRSQMAEGWVRSLLSDRFEVRSAGTRPEREVNPLAVRSMAEVGIDISGATPKSVESFLGEPWDLVVTVCDSAQETCPFFPGRVERLHESFPDPARAVGSEEVRLAAYRAVRDDIRGRLLARLRAWADERSR